MKFGLTESDYAFLLKSFQKAGLGEAKVYCFGSRARGDQNKFSDLDLMIEGKGDLSKVVRELKEQFEESRLSIKVDLVTFKDFSERYRTSYENDKVLFFASSDKLGG